MRTKLRTVHCVPSVRRCVNSLFGGFVYGHIQALEGSYKFGRYVRMGDSHRRYARSLLFQEIYSPKGDRVELAQRAGPLFAGGRGSW